MRSLLSRKGAFINGYAIATALLLVGGLVTYRSLSRLLEHEAWVDHTHLVLVRLESIMSLLKDTETGQRGYLLTGEDDFLEPLHRAERLTDREQLALDSLTADNAVQQQRLDTLHALVARNYALLQADLNAYRIGKKYDVARLRQSKKLMDRLRGLVSRLQAEEQRLLIVRRQRTDEYARIMYPFLWALSLFVAGLASWRLQRSQAAEHNAKLESSARFAQLLETIPHMTWTSQPNGALNYFNRQWSDYTGAGTEELTQNLAAYLHPDDLEYTRAAWQQALRTKAPMPELRSRWKRGHDEQYRWHLARAVPLLNSEGEIVLWVGTNTDIHSQQLQQQELERVNTDLDNFIYSASHDLKTPISNIEALLTALREELNLPPPHVDVPPLLEFMDQAVHRFKRTIGQMTEVVKLQKSQNQLKKEVELVSLIRNVCLDLGPLFSDADVHIDVDVDACPTLFFAEKNLHSIVYNLLSNALKYRHPERPVLVKVHCYPAGNYNVLSVQDNGLGMDLGPVEESKLFGLFQRLHDHVEGSGVGLYMVRKIIVNGGGRIEVASQVGVGSTFKVYFPQ